MTAGSRNRVGIGAGKPSNVARRQRQKRVTDKTFPVACRALSDEAGRCDRRSSPITRTPVLAGPSLPLVLFPDERIVA